MEKLGSGRLGEVRSSVLLEVVSHEERCNLSRWPLGQMTLH
jgi:hypothetical protein